MKVFDKETIRSIYNPQIKQLWQTSPDTFPDFLPTFDNNIKNTNEQWITSASDTIQKQLHTCPKLFGKERWRNESEHLLTTLLTKAPLLGLSKAMSQELQQEFLQETKRFLKRSRDFDKELSIEDLGQAIRNYIVYGVFCILSDMPQHCHSAIWGYSMLYPYTDNYIDSHSISSADKNKFNQFIYAKLKGKRISPVTKAQTQTGALLDAVENFYPRSCNSDIYDGLLMMLEAQEYSLKQAKESLSEEDILAISIYKGGVSVLLDRFYVEKEMTEEEIRFYLAYGFFLQLADDLQDISSDELEGSRTILNLQSDSAYKERMVNKILHFLHTILTTWLPESKKAADGYDFTSFLLNKCYLLILSAVWRSKEHFTDDYLTKVEAALPISFAYIETTTKSFNSKPQGNSDSLMTALDVLLENMS
ncbi:MAG: hypothetical protein IJ485_06880 [Lachnospiraceae bacterium]|nr:hypothetical protein [Lachnospiraceae bacterium]